MQYRVEILFAPDEQEALKAINGADQVILVAHGAGDGKRTGGVRLRGSKNERKTNERDDEDILSANDIKRARGNRKLKKIVLIACAQASPKYLDGWFDVAEEVFGSETTVSIWGVGTGDPNFKRYRRPGRSKVRP